MCVCVCGLQSLVTHDSHADSATFGPSRTSLSQPIADWIHTYIEIKNATAAPRSLYLFPSDSDASKPLSSTKWTRTVKSVWKRHSGVPLCPKVYAARRQGHAPMTRGTHLTRLRRILLTGSALILHHMAQVGDAFEQDASLCGGGDAALLQDAGERRVRQGGEQPSRVRRRRRCVRLRCHLRSPPRTMGNGKRMRGEISLASRIYPHQ